MAATVDSLPQSDAVAPIFRDETPAPGQALCAPMRGLLVTIDELVRRQSRGLPVRPGQKRSPQGRDRGQLAPGRRAEPEDRKAGPPLQGLHRRTRKSRSRQRRVVAKAEWTQGDAIRALSSPRSPARSTRPAISMRSSMAPWRDGKPHQGTSARPLTPTAPRPTPCARTSCACGSP